MTVDDLQARRSEGAAEVACPPGPRILLGRGHRPVTAGYVPAESGGMLTQTYPARQRTAGPVLWALTCGITGLVANVLLMLDQLTENVGDIRQYFMSPAVIAWGDGCSVCARGVVSGGPAIAAAGLLFPAGSAAWRRRSRFRLVGPSGVAIGFGPPRLQQAPIARLQRGRHVMRTAYKVLAYLVAVEVAVQARVMVWAIAGLGKWVDSGGMFDNGSEGIST
jgi:hypothetical protein